MNTIVVPLMEFKFDQGQKGRFKGYGSTFGNVDLGKDICVNGCFMRSLGEHKAAGTMPSMYWMHDRTEPIGDWIDAKEDANGLVVEGQLWADDIENAKKAYRMLSGTGNKGLSIGYATKKSEYDDKTGVRRLLDVDLPEISVVGHGMNPKALVTSIKSRIADGLLPTVRDLEEVLRDAGLSNAQAKALLSDGFKALRRDDAAADESQKIIRLLQEIRGNIASKG